MTIDDLILNLQTLKKESPLKGDTVVFRCSPGIEYQPLKEVKLEADEEIPGACLLLMFEED